MADTEYDNIEVKYAMTVDFDYTTTVKMFDNKQLMLKEYHEIVKQAVKLYKEKGIKSFDEVYVDVEYYENGVELPADPNNFYIELTTWSDIEYKVKHLNRLELSIINYNNRKKRLHGKRADIFKGNPNAFFNEKLYQKGLDIIDGYITKAEKDIKELLNSN